MDELPTCWTATWMTGPDAGRTWPFPGDRNMVIGRAPLADIRCDDPLIEPFHVQLCCTPRHRHVVQLAGRSPIRVDGDAITIGSSVLEVRQVATDVAVPTTVSTAITVIRTPRTVPVWEPAPVAMGGTEPHPGEPGSGGVVPAVVALGGAGVVALLMRQPMFVLFGLIGAVAAVATWVTGRVAHRRRRRRHAAAVAERCDRFAADLAAQQAAWEHHHHSTAPWLPVMLTDLWGGSGTIWQRRSGHPDAHTICIGTGTVTFEPTIAPGTASAAPLERALHVTGQPVCVDAGAFARIAVAGSSAIAVVRAAVVGLAIATGPADWQLIVVTEQAEHWAWVRSLPHVADDAGSPRVVTPRELHDLGHAATSPGCHTVVVTDIGEQLSMRTSPLRRLMTASPDVAVIVALAGGAPFPAICTTVVSTRVDGTARLVADAQAGTAPTEFRFVGMSARAAQGSAEVLGTHRDPEDPRTAGGDVPHTMSLFDLLDEHGVDPLDAGSIEAMWRGSAIDAPPSTPIGRAADGVVDIDLVRDGPHALLAGTTGAGKSELLRSLVLGLACRLDPDRLTFVLVDYKGGATFDALTALPHVVGLVTDLDGALADRALRSLRAELTIRERVLRTWCATDLAAARRASGEALMPRLVVVVDEFAALAAEHPGFLHALVGIAQRGRSLGVHLILATQRPNGVIDDAIRANTTLRLALRLNDAADAMDVVGDPLPATLSRAVPGRAVMRLGPDELVTFQTASCLDESTRQAALASSVRAVLAAAAGASPPRRPWLEPLPATIDAPVADGVVGIVDLPDEQAQEPLAWRPHDGNVLVIGAPGSGVTSTLLTLANAALTTPTPPELFVIDAVGDRRWDELLTHPRCAAVVRLHERERLWRLLRRIGGQRGDEGAVLVIDGIAALRHELEPLDRTADLERLERLLATAEGDVTLLIGTDIAGRLPASLLARCPHRWVHHLHDAHDGAALGIPAAAVPGSIAGRVAIASAGVPRIAQVFAPRSPSPPQARSPRVAPVEELAVLIDPDTMVPSAHDGQSWRAVLGVRCDNLAPLEIEVPDGDHLLIVGPGRSGKSRALLRLIDSWNGLPETSAPRATVVLAQRRSPLANSCTTIADALEVTRVHLAAGRPTLLAVDDADLVHDDSGQLAAWVAARTAGLVVAAAGRAEALRQTYGHWTTAVRRSRLGVILTGAGDTDADLFGVVLPRSLPVAPRPGLAHVVDGSDLVLGQLALSGASAGHSCVARPEGVRHRRPALVPRP
jgi:DNA segregation ATPase FtsK/SpoIIIE, S-DNA-T family